jgi:hypothetical protein
MTKTPKRSSDLANGETSEGDPPTSRDSVANALDRWDEEGGGAAWARQSRKCERAAFGPPFMRPLRFSRRPIAGNAEASKAGQQHGPGRWLGDRQTPEHAITFAVRPGGEKEGV